MHPLVALVILSCFVLLGLSHPDDKLNVTQIIQARGYPVEDHEAITSDGFVLSLQRITGKRYTSGSPNVKKPVVVLQHGLLDNSITWVVQEVVEECLGFILADQGYDVWLPNVRGNTYSNKNIYYESFENEFWSWSFDEMAHIDLPTYLSYILRVTGQSKVSYVGHSQGTTIGFVGFEDPSIASKVNVFIALAPVGWVYHTSSVLMKVLAELHLQDLFVMLGVQNFSPSGTLLDELVPDVCSAEPSLCNNLLGLVMGWDPTNINTTRLPQILAHEPSGTSMQNIVHWSQEITDNVFQRYDYGDFLENEFNYGQPTPPQFNPSAITIPTALFTGGNDALADPTDVAALVPLLRNVVFSHDEPSYSHLDFVWGVNACTKIYPQVLQLIQTYGGKPGAN